MYTYPERFGNTNVVGKVEWKCTFNWQGFESMGVGETALRIAPDESFIPLDQLTKQNIIDFVISSNGGPNWIERMKELHLDQLVRMKHQSMMIECPLPQN